MNDHEEGFAVFTPSYRDAFLGEPFLSELRAHLRGQIEEYQSALPSLEGATLSELLETLEGATSVNPSLEGATLSELLKTLEGATSVNPSLIPWDNNELAIFTLNRFLNHVCTPLPPLKEGSISAFFTALQAGLDIHVKTPNSETLLLDWVYSLDEVPAGSNIYSLQRGDWIRVLSIVGIIDAYRSFLVAVCNGDGSSKPSQSPLANDDGAIEIADGFIDLCRISSKLCLAGNATIAPHGKNG